MSELESKVQLWGGQHVRILRTFCPKLDSLTHITQERATYCWLFILPVFSIVTLAEQESIYLLQRLLSQSRLHICPTRA